MTVIATAGHVDHGKSTLVLRLTGTDPDRWTEEKSRGLTIDLGFASTKLPSGTDLSFIDVPGHIRFLRNMLSGVGAVDGCLFVVAATEGWKPQSEEHLRILNLLGLKRGIIALTKIDLVDDDLFELAKMDVEEHVEGTFLEGAEIIGVSAPDAIGIDELRHALDRLVADVDQESRDGKTRLWIDRSFAPAGAGTVVTGTLTGGPVASGEELQVMPAAKTARIRGLQSHHQDVERVAPGNRVAVNLTGIGHGEISRGDLLVQPGKWHHTAMIDAELTVLESLGHPVTRKGAYATYIGSGEFPSRLRVLQGTRIEPGESGLVRLYLNRKVPLLPGDRFILRESGRDETVGGGQVLDVEPQLPASKANPNRSLERLIAERGWVDAEHLSRLTGEQIEPAVGRRVVDPAELESAKKSVLEAISAADALGLDVASLDERHRAVADILEEVQVQTGRATIGEVADPLADHPWVIALAAEPFAPPDASGVDRGELRELVRRGTVIENDGVYFARTAVDQAVALVRDGLTAKPKGLTVAEIRDLLGTTRKYVLPLLAHLDGNGITRRREDVRIAGPRMPEA